MNTNSNGDGASPVKYCPRCGRALPVDAVFCAGCGANLAENASYATAPTPVVDTTPLKTSDYLILLLLMAIPVVGLILMIVWSFSSDTNLNRRNFCRANLIMQCISFVLALLLIIFYVILIGSFVMSGDLFASTIGFFLH